MSDKQHKKIVEQYAALRKEYNSLIGLNISSKHVESEVYAKLSVNEIKIEDIQMDIEMLTTDIANMKDNEIKYETKKTKKRV